MGFGNKILASAVSLSILSGAPKHSDSIEAKYFGGNSDLIENIDFKNRNLLKISDLLEIKNGTKKEISICMEQDKNSYTNSEVLKSITNPQNTILEFPVSQLFQTYGKRPHPLTVKGIKRNFRALLGKDGIENLSEKIPQKIAPRSEKITSDTKYELGDTIRFSLIDPSLEGAFPHYLSDQLQEQGFKGFLDPDAQTISKIINEKKEKK